MSGIGVRVRNLHLNLNNRQLLKVRNLKCLPGECVCLIGANGSGKSLLLEALCGIYHNDESVQYFRDNDGGIKYFSPRNVRIGAMLQRFNLWPRIRISELIALIEKFSGKTIPENDFVCSIKDSLYKNLSAGERQFLYFWLVVNSISDIWIFDEPTMGMDACNYSCVIETLRNKHLAVICTFHNFRDVLSLADRCYFICQGAAIRLNIIPTEDLRRSALIEIVNVDSEERNNPSSQSVISKYIEIENENDVELMNREIIPVMKSDINIEGVSINLMISRNIYAEYRTENF